MWMFYEIPVCKPYYSTMKQKNYLTYAFYKNNFRKECIVMF